MARNDEKKSVRCSFCGKPQSLVNRLVAGNGVYICDECVRLCMSIIDEGYEPESVSTAQVTLRRDQLPKPAEMRATLDDYIIGHPGHYHRAGVCQTGLAGRHASRDRGCAGPRKIHQKYAGRGWGH